jgi:hypothetical protein
MLYETKPNNLTLIQSTHFNEWFTDDEYNNSSNIENDYAIKANEILNTWEETLQVKIPRPNFAKNGIELGFELVVDSLIDAGFSAYIGDEFIEIYKN